MTRRSVFLLFLLSVVVSGPRAVAVRAGETPPEWDQTAVAELAGGLAAAVQQLLDEPGLSQPQQSAIQGRMRDAALSDLKRLAPRLADLAERLAAGEGLRQTRAVFTDIRHLRENIRTYAKDAEFAPDTRARIAAVRDRFDQLATFYEGR
jgi:hypothetical protein